MTPVAPRIVNDVSYAAHSTGVIRSRTGVVLSSTESYWGST